VSAVATLHQETDVLCGVAKDERTHERLYSARPPLAHVIYVERTRVGTYGVVQFFGVLQFHCTLGQGSPAPECALFGVLNSITGEETFRPVDPLNVSSLPQPSPAFAKKWAEKLFDQVGKIGWADFSEVRLIFTPSFLIALFVGSTTDAWPFGQIPTGGAKRPRRK
jgi:hypothetical protein